MSMAPFVNYYVIILLQLAAIAIAVQINEREEKQIVLFDIASLHDKSENSTFVSRENNVITIKRKWEDCFFFPVICYY